MDAITLLKNDHEQVEGMFTRFEAAGHKAYKAKRKLVDRMIAALAAHAWIEEQVFYPQVRESVPSMEDTVLEGLEEHHIVKWTLSELDGMDPEEERFEPKVTVLMESVRHHVEEEEGELFPEVSGAMDSDQLEELGKALAQAKKMAPSRPHPAAPDTPRVRA